LAGVLKNKKLKVCFAHGGGSFLPPLAALSMAGLSSRLVAIDNPVNPKEYLGSFGVDSHVCDHKMLQYVIDLVGARQGDQGSDYLFR